MGNAPQQASPTAGGASRRRRVGRRLSLVALALLAFLAVAIPGALALDQTFVVNSPNWADDGTCDGAHCSLREAMNAANAAAGHDTIEFDISGDGVHTILATTAPPFISNAVTINATTESDYAGIPRVELDGVGAPGGSNGLFFSVNSGTSTVLGLGINRWQAGVTTQSGTTVSVEDSYIGVSAGDGVTPRANGSGMVFLGGSNHVVEGNLISGNSQVGVRFQDVAGATVRGNRIGTNAAGTAALANGVNDTFNFFSGLEIAPTGLTGASGIVIGGSGAGQGNLISGNARSGIDIYPSSGRTVDDTVVQGNLIGTNAAGTSAIGNGWHGIHIRGFNVNGPTTDTTIGGTTAGQGNTIAFNGRDGISIDTNAPGPENFRNHIRGNVIHGNGTSVNHLGIDLGTDGVTANDEDDVDGGANDLQNFPVLTSVTSGGDQTIIDGTFNSFPSGDFALEFFVIGACDASGNGEGAMLIGSTTAVTNASGDGTFHVELAGLLDVDDFVTATATDPSGNTSEFSACEAIEAGSGLQPGPTFTVNTTGDATPADAGCSTTDCTLREAIDAANGQAGPNAIEFDIPGAGAHTIEPDSQLPAITERVTIDGTTQTGYAGSPLVELDGTTVTDSGSLPGHGLQIAGNDSVVRGLAINRFSASGPASGIHIQGDNNTVESSYIGTDVTGTLARPNGIGIELTGASSGNTIGGSAIARNVISGNNDRGVSLMGGATGTLVDNNYIGVDATGLDPLGNGVYGMQISATGSNTVKGNLITDNASGVVIAGAASQVIDSNGIGINEVGDVLGQLGAGISISNSSGNSIISNTIAGHTDTGILVDEFGGTANGNEIRFNEITQSTFLGIDLDPEPRGVTPNDLDDPDTGANGLQNFPVITSAVVGSGNTTIDGTLNSTPGLTFQLDFFSNVSCDPSGNGEGATYLGSETVTTDAGGDTPFSFFVENDLSGLEVTATATGGSGTSEFSACVTVGGPQPGPTFTVNTTADGEPADAGCSVTDCTLREAIVEANGAADPNTIEFDIAGAAPHTILLDSELPAVGTDVTIDATTEPDWAGPPVVEISGDGPSEIGTGLVITGEAATVRGLAIGGFFVHGIDATGGQLTLEGNHIGTDVAGTVAHENGVGVRLAGSLNTIQGNLISGNVVQGLLIEDSSTNTVRGNQIGTDGLGTAAIPNNIGIEILSSEGSVDGNHIGGDQPGEGNLVSANVSAGILLRSTVGAPGVTGTEIEGNLVGTAAGGVSNLGNGGDGVQLGSLGNLAGNSVGGTGPGQGNTIKFNAGAGVSILDAPGNVDNAIRGNSIDANGGVGIDLNADGATPNDEGDLDGGANGGQNFPVVANATANETGTTINAELNSAPTTTYDIDFYASATCDPSGNGEGATYLGSTQITTGPGGNWVFPHTVATSLAAGTQVTATATGPGGTSEFSACVAVQEAAPSNYVVDSSDDGSPDVCTPGDCTLREAIEASNGDSTASTIEFDLVDTSILLAGPLPAITAPVTIAGASQPEGRVLISGGEVGVPADGLVLAPGSGGSTIDRIALEGFTDSGVAGIRVQSGANTITGTHFFTVYDGIVVEGEDAAANTIGGSFPAGDGNRLWDFSHYAIELDAAPTGNVIAGNTIGIDASGAPQTLIPGSTGIFAMDTPGAVIGHNVGPGGLGAIDGSRSNVIVRTTFGIFFESGVTGARVTGNFVGVNRTGVATDLGVASTGIELSGSSDRNQLGPGNTIARNGSHGVRINHSTDNRIVANSIHSNGGLGISLNSANQGLEPPTLFSAVDSGSGTATVSGEITGPSGTYFVEFFENTSCDPSEFGEGETYRGFAIVDITNNESASFVGDTFPGVATGDILTATLTEAAVPESTSQFSLCTLVEAEAAPSVPPVLFGAVVDATPGTLGVAGLVDTGVPQAGQVLDVQFYSVPACDPVAPKTPLGTGANFVTNENGIAGFAKDGLTNVPIGTTVLATATPEGGTASAISNCVIADRSNTAWHTAHPLAPTDTETGALRAAGEGRWFKVPILPNSRVEVSVSDLPADYDLIAFSDIPQAYEQLVGTDVDPQLGPNLAVTDLQREGAETQTDVFNTSQYDPSSWDPTNWNPDLNTETSVFSASQWSASQWSPSQWSASQWSASQWSPSQWSASQWSASQWSASQWSASQWSPSQWSASQWSPSQWSSATPADPRAFSSAQTASLLAVSAGPGTGDESVSVNTWNNTGDFYFRVQGKNGSFDPEQPFSISVDREGSLCEGVLDQMSTPTAPAGLGTPKTLILKDTRRLAMGTVIGGSTLNTRLDTLAARPDVQGVVVDADADPVVRSLNTQADAPAHRSCPFAKNLVASAIKRIVDAYRARYPSIQYLVVVGDDTVVPFFRYPDPALMGSETLYVPPVRDDTTSQASLRLGYILSDDFLASSESVSRGGKRLPVTDLAAGRLVETPQEIAGMLDAYLGTTGGVVATPTSSLTTGYDFLTDAADEIAGHFGAGIGGTANRTLITEQTISPGVTTPPGTAPTRDKSWTADDLRNALLGPNRHDLIFLAGHFSANDALAADYRTNVLTTELDAASTNLVNSIVFSAGCHAGYNIVNGHATEWTEPLDWAQAFARKRATLISGTGYQYGDTDFLAHGERIYAEFARQLRVTTAAGGAAEPVAVGQALLRAKQIFLRDTPGLTSLDEKSLLQTTLFGLPMLSVNMPGERLVEPPEISIVDETEPVGSGPGEALGLESAGVTLDTPLPPPESKQLKDGPLATWLEGPDGVAVRPTQPILPLRSFDVTPPDSNTALRGVGFRRGTYVDTGGTTPLTAAPATELRGIHGPFFSDVFFPTQPWSVNYFDALDGGSTFLHTTPAQHRSESPTMTRRAFSDLGLQLFYSGNVQSYCPGELPLRSPTVDNPCVGTAVTPALAAPPTISGVETSFADGVLTLKARVIGDPSAGIQKVWAAWTIPPAVGQEGEWAPVDFEQDTSDEALWTGELELEAGVDPGDVHFVVQAVNGVGRVTIDDNLGATYRPGSIPGNANTPPGAPDPVATELTFTTPPPASVAYGQAFQVTVHLTSEGADLAERFVNIGIGPNGIPVETDANGLATLQLQASLAPGPYEVTASFSGDATHADSDVSAPLTIARRPTTLVIGGSLTLAPSSIHTILTAAPSTPLHQRSVFLIFTGTGPANVGHTDVFAGKTDPIGRVDVTDEFLAALPAGNYRVDAYFNGVNVPGVLVLPEDSPEYTPATATANLVFRPDALHLLDQAVELLLPLAARPGAAGDKAEDALAKVRSAIDKYSRNIRQGAVGDLEGAAGDLQAGVNNRLLTAAEVRPIQELITAAAWVIALEARDRAVARGGRARLIAEANNLITQGNQRWAQRRYKDAIARYKDAVAKAESA